MPHGRHVVSPSLLYSVELLQARQAVPPCKCWTVPGAHRLQIEKAPPENEPGRHPTHSMPPDDDWNVPDRHWRHTLIPAAGS